MKRLAMLAGIMWCLAGSSVASAQWHFGIGTGLSATKLDGTQGAYSPVFGTVEAEVKLDPDEFQDLVSTAFGLGGYATDGKWMITVSGGFIELAGDGSGTTSEGVDISTDLTFTITSFEAHVGYSAYRSSNMKFSLEPYAGVRYTDHKIENDFVADEDSTFIEHDNSWADGLIGVSIGYAFSPKFAWGASVDGGFGGSEGMVTGKTSFTWKPLKHWSFSPNATFQNGKYEASEKGETDWYLYDMKQTQFGLSFLYHF